MIEIYRSKDNNVTKFIHSDGSEIKAACGQFLCLTK
jgi:hypothetical protein